MKNNKNLNEIWKPITGFPGYFVSNWGEIMSKKRYKNGKLRGFSYDKDGYARVILRANGKSSTIYVHRLVAQEFCENPDPMNKIVVNHKDENKLNNHAENLEWATPAENAGWGYLAKRNRVLNLRKYHSRNPGRYSKGLSMFDKDDNLLRTFSSAREAADFLVKTGLAGYVHPHSLTNVASGKSPDWKGYKFKYLAGTGTQPINAYDKNGNLVGTYETLAEAAKAFKAAPSQVRRAAIGERKTCRDHRFSFVNPPF